MLQVLPPLILDLSQILSPEQKLTGPIGEIDTEAGTF